MKTKLPIGDHGTIELQNFAAVLKEGKTLNNFELNELAIDLEGMMDPVRIEQGLAEMWNFIHYSYKFGQNPLPMLRKTFSYFEWIYVENDYPSMGDLGGLRSGSAIKAYDANYLFQCGVITERMVIARRKGHSARFAVFYEGQNKEKYPGLAKFDQDEDPDIMRKLGYTIIWSDQVL